MSDRPAKRRRLLRRQRVITDDETTVGEEENLVFHLTERLDWDRSPDREVGIDSEGVQHLRDERRALLDAAEADLDAVFEEEGSRHLYPVRYAETAYHDLATDCVRLVVSFCDLHVLLQQRGTGSERHLEVWARFGDQPNPSKPQRIVASLVEVQGTDRVEQVVDSVGANFYPTLLPMIYGRFGCPPKARQQTGGFRGWALPVFLGISVTGSLGSCPRAWVDYLNLQIATDLPVHKLERLALDVSPFRSVLCPLLLREPLANVGSHTLRSVRLNMTLSSGRSIDQDHLRLPAFRWLHRVADRVSVDLAISGHADSSHLTSTRDGDGHALLVRTSKYPRHWRTIDSYGNGLPELHDLLAHVSGRVSSLTIENAETASGIIDTIARSTTGPTMGTVRLRGCVVPAKELAGVVSSGATRMLYADDSCVIVVPHLVHRGKTARIAVPRRDGVPLACVALGHRCVFDTLSSDLALTSHDVAVELEGYKRQALKDFAAYLPSDD